MFVFLKIKSGERRQRFSLCIILINFHLQAHETEVGSCFRQGSIAEERVDQHRKDAK